jgi:uncharacterized protein involved in exopolysaccharide biosynthesis
MTALLGSATRRPGPGSDTPTLSGLRTKYAALFGILQEVDEAPTTQAQAALLEIERQLPPLLQQWQEVKNKELPALNQKLRDANQPELKLTAGSARSSAVVSAKDKDEE